MKFKITYWKNYFIIWSIQDEWLMNIDTCSSTCGYLSSTDDETLIYLALKYKMKSYDLKATQSYNGYISNHPKSIKFDFEGSLLEAILHIELFHQNGLLNNEN